MEKKPKRTVKSSKKKAVATPKEPDRTHYDLYQMFRAKEQAEHFADFWRNKDRKVKVELAENPRLGTLFWGVYVEERPKFRPIMKQEAKPKAEYVHKSLEEEQEDMERQLREKAESLRIVKHKPIYEENPDMVRQRVREKIENEMSGYKNMTSQQIEEARKKLEIDVNSSGVKAPTKQSQQTKKGLWERFVSWLGI